MMYSRWLSIVLFLVIPDLSRGQTSCPAGSSLSNEDECTPCPLHTYKPEEGPQMCTPCPFSEDDDGFQLHTSETGTVDVDGCTDRVYIAEFYPKYGPIAGGTEVNITVAHLQHERTINWVKIKKDCSILDRGDSWITCKTQNVERTRWAAVNLEVSGNWSDYEIQYPHEQYEYRPDPIIHSISNPVTMASGGVPITVFGEYLTSVARPVIVITRIFRQEEVELRKVCHVESAERMICEIPDLTEGLGDEFWLQEEDEDGHDYEDEDEDEQQEQEGEEGDVTEADSTTPLYMTPTFKPRTRPSEMFTQLPEDIPGHDDESPDDKEGGGGGGTDDDDDGGDDDDVNGGNNDDDGSGRGSGDGDGDGDDDDEGGRHWHWGGRHKRQAVDEGPINEEDLAFVVGFELDGIVYDDFATLQVYENPEFDQFDETNTVREFSPEEDVLLIIRGQRLNLAITMNDVIVEIGVADCPVTSLTSNQVTCHPPEEEPEPGPQGFGPDRSLTVTVFVGNLAFVAGYLRYVDGSETNLYILIAIIVAVVLFWAIFAWLMVAFFCPHVRKRRRESKLKKERLTSTSTVSSGETLFRIDTSDASSLSSRLASSSSTDDPFDILDCFDQKLRERILKCQIPASRLEIGALVGLGTFGRVCTGTLKSKRKDEKPKTVAVKTLKENDLSYLGEISSFLKEALIMQGLQHPNILALHGVVIKDNVPYVLFDYMDRGDLKFYMLRSEKELCEPELLGYALQVAQGMAYMSALGYIHRDLAARNCLINSQKIVKIGDFGLARDLHEKDYYRTDQAGKALPVKWMAVETLMSGRYDTRTDVWSFGVLLWELFNNGRGPYPDVQNIDLKDYLAEGHRLSKPEKASLPVYALMSNCWEPLAEDRPLFRDIVKRIKKMMNSKTLMKL